MEGLGDEQWRVTRRRFFGAGGQRRCSGIRNLQAFGVEKPEVETSSPFFSSIPSTAGLEGPSAAYWSSWAGSDKVFRPTRQFLQLVFLLPRLQDGAI
ncbi:hypothetical protein COCNU_contig69536937G000010 [Cocos nucifera]|nr:hypothetical protein [Cocos nucifera]